jgi:phage portal protein BeeE
MDKALGWVGLQRKASPVFWPEGVDPGATGYAGELVNSSSAMALSAVHACANLISGTISSLPFELHRLGGNGLTEVAGLHPLHS